MITEEMFYGIDIPDEIDIVSFLLCDDGYIVMLDDETGEIIERFIVH